nr:peptidoglycan DD-metalloendopeptidase family protein [Methylomarinum sp. Ch1-1]MDP4520967.1 peptidoglycan DD-metalloendopeptidase family protein [Methylomarinum sp. Ch1-1]
MYWQWPIQGKILKSFSQTGNKGIDIGGKLGQSVKAAAGGKVVYSGHGLVGYGNLLIIKHSSLYLSAYGHNRRLLVKEGQVVKKGQTIAEVGKAGARKLHYILK